MSDSKNSANVDFFSDDEKAVAEILVDLPGLISDCERRQYHDVYWKTKGKGSVLEDSYTATTSSSPVSEKSQSKKKKKNVVMAAAAAATSPCTTLAFPSSESDEYKQSNSKKRQSFSHETEKKPRWGMNGGFIEHCQYQRSGNFRDPYAQRTPMGMGTPPYSGLGLVNGTCFCGASPQPLDLNRVLMRLNAAQARRARMMKIKEARKQRRSQSQHFNAP